MPRREANIMRARNYDEASCFVERINYGGTSHSFLKVQLKTKQSSMPHKFLDVKKSKIKIGKSMYSNFVLIFLHNIKVYAFENTTFLVYNFLIVLI